MDQEGTISAFNVQVFVDRGTVWTFGRINPEEFMKIKYEKRLEASDLPYWGSSTLSGTTSTRMEVRNRATRYCSSS